MVLKIFKWLFWSKDNKKEQTYTPLINPFLTSVFLWNDDLSINQLIGGLTYYRTRNTEIANAIKKSLKWHMKLEDIEKIEGSDQQMDSADYFTNAMEYIRNKNPEEADKIDLYLKENGENIDRKHYANWILNLYKDVNSEYIITKINNLLEIPWQKRDGFIKYLKEDRRKTGQWLYSKDLTKKEHSIIYDKLEQLMNDAKQSFNMSKELFSIQRLLWELSMIAKRTNDKTLEERINITENMYLYWERMNFQIQWNINEDKKDIELYKDSWYDTNLKIRPPMITNVELGNQILNELRILNEKKNEIEKSF